jgi:hypothetical protein
MKKITYLFTLSLSLMLISCSQSKQFDSCSSMASNLQNKHYSDLVKDWGEPISKEDFNTQWDVVWEGVGVNGKNVKIKFDSISIGTDVSPDTFIGIVDCN